MSFRIVNAMQCNTVLQTVCLIKNSYMLFKITIFILVKVIPH